MSINAKQLLLVLVGYDPAFTIPWNTILMGIGIVLGIALLAGLWPAASTARTDPLELLAGGRAAV
jgi:ABC-type antimicrobial peptide transport system permease subunit